MHTLELNTTEEQKVETMFENFNLNESQPAEKTETEQKPTLDFFNEPVQQTTVETKPVENTNQQGFMDFNTMQNLFATNMHNVMNPQQVPFQQNQQPQSQPRPYNPVETQQLNFQQPTIIPTQQQ